MDGEVHLTEQQSVHLKLNGQLLLVTSFQLQFLTTPGNHISMPSALFMSIPIKKTKKDVYTGKLNEQAATIQHAHATTEMIH